MKYDKLDWRHYLKPDELEMVEAAEAVANRHDAQKKKALLSIHYIRNAACQRRRHAIGPLTGAASK